MTAKKHILVVDDDEATARLLARFLHEYEVTIAYDGMEGLDQAIACHPQLIITDLWMPRMDGIEMVEALKGDPALHHVPVIFLTAVNDASHVAHAITAGARHYLPKPVDVDKLLTLVKRSLSWDAEQTSAAHG